MLMGVLLSEFDIKFIPRRFESSLAIPPNKLKSTDLTRINKLG
jgi:hypothetical protein